MSTSEVQVTDVLAADKWDVLIDKNWLLMVSEGIFRKILEKLERIIQSTDTWWCRTKK